MLARFPLENAKCEMQNAKCIVEGVSLLRKRREVKGRQESCDEGEGRPEYSVLTDCRLATQIGGEGGDEGEELKITRACQKQRLISHDRRFPFHTRPARPHHAIGGRERAKRLSVSFVRGMSVLVRKVRIDGLNKKPVVSHIGKETEIKIRKKKKKKGKRKKKIRVKKKNKKKTKGPHLIVQSTDERMQKCTCLLKRMQVQVAGDKATGRQRQDNNVRRHITQTPSRLGRQERAASRGQNRNEAGPVWTEKRNKTCGRSQGQSFLQQGGTPGLARLGSWPGKSV